VQPWFKRTVLARRWAAFAILGLCFFGFGVGTLNLFRGSRTFPARLSF
jgi:hypothetical protein